MSLSSRVLAAIDRAKKSLGDLVVTATVVQTRNTGYSATNLQPTQTTASVSVNGFVGSWSESELREYAFRNADMDVRVGDVAFYVFPTTADPRVDDSVTLDGVSYVVKKTLPVMVGNQVGLTLLQLRR